MSAQVDFCLFRNAFLSCLQFGACKICTLLLIKVLLTYFRLLCLASELISNKPVRKDRQASFVRKQLTNVLKR